MKKLLTVLMFLMLAGSAYAGSCPIPEPVGCPNTTINMDNNTVTGDVTFTDDITVEGNVTGSGGAYTSQTIGADINNYFYSSIEDITIDDGGTGYTSGNLVFTGCTSGTSAAGTFTATAGVIDSITITNQGTGYYCVPSVDGDAGGNADAFLSPVMYQNRFPALIIGDMDYDFGRRRTSATAGLLDIGSLNDTGLGIETHSTAGWPLSQMHFAAKIGFLDTVDDTASRGGASIFTIFDKEGAGYTAGSASGEMNTLRLSSAFTGLGTLNKSVTIDSISEFYENTGSATVTDVDGIRQTLMTSGLTSQNITITTYRGLHLKGQEYAGPANQSPQLGGTDWYQIYVADWPNYDDAAVANKYGMWMENIGTGKAPTTNRMGIVLDGDGAGSDIVLGANQDAKIYWTGSYLYLYANDIFMNGPTTANLRVGTGPAQAIADGGSITPTCGSATLIYTGASNTTTGNITAGTGSTPVGACTGSNLGCRTLIINVEDVGRDTITLDSDNANSDMLTIGDLDLILPPNGQVDLICASGSWRQISAVVTVSN